MSDIEDQVIIYPNSDGGICIVWPVKDHPILDIANKDIPPGTPYRIIPATSLPNDGAWRSAWKADFSNPDGVSTGRSEYFANLNNMGIPAAIPNVPDGEKPWPKV